MNRHTPTDDPADRPGRTDRTVRTADPGAPETEATDDRADEAATEEPFWKRPVDIPVWGIALTILVFLLLVLILWSAKRRHQTEVIPPQFESFADSLESIALLTQGPILDGNAVTIYQNEAFFDALIADIEKATESVHFETYVWWQGEICHRLTGAFVERAQAGVPVRLLIDALGGSDMDEELRTAMEEAGVDVVDYHPWELRHIGQINNRDHRKAAILDGRVAYVFGHGVAAEWGTGEWRDTAVRLEGPVVGSVQAVFMENWMEETGDAPVGEAVFPTLEPAGFVAAHVTKSSPAGVVSSVELLYKIAIVVAKETILIQNPYFVPDPDVVDLLTDAVERGVRVRLMLPGDNDSAIVQHAGHSYYERLLAGGVEVYEYQPSLLHQKIMVVDGLWSHVGSTNFDARSLQINDELSVGLIDPDVAAQLTRAFEDDLEESLAIDLDAWRERSLWHRTKDRAAYLLNEQL